MTPITDKIEELIKLVKFIKPKDRSPEDRKFAIVITELEKVKAYVMQYLEANNGS